MVERVNNKGKFIRAYFS